MRYAIACLLIMIAPAAHAEGPQLFSSMHQRLSYLGTRQQVLADNIANANTPGFKAHDLKPLKLRSATPTTPKLRMMVTNPGHIMAARSRGSAYDTSKNRDDFETTISGNNVSLDEEMRKVAENNLDFQATSGLYKKWNTVLRTAVGSRQ